MPKWLKWVIGGAVIVGLGIATIATGGATAPALIASGANAVAGLIGGLSWDDNGFYYDWDKAATGFMTGSIIGAVSGGVSAGLLSGAKMATESFAYRGIMTCVDGVLGIGQYFAQNAINGSINSMSGVGVFFAFAGGLFDMGMPVGKIIDAIWGPVMTAEIGWAYDVITTAKKTREQSVIVAQY